MQKCPQRLESCWLFSTEKTRPFAQAIFKAEKPILLSSWFSSSNIITQLCEHKQDLCLWAEELSKPLWFRSQRLTGLMNLNFESSQHKIQQKSNLSCNVPVQTINIVPVTLYSSPRPLVWLSWERGAQQVWAHPAAWAGTACTQVLCSVVVSLAVEFIQGKGAASTLFPWQQPWEFCLHISELLLFVLP